MQDIQLTSLACGSQRGHPTLEEVVPKLGTKEEKELARKIQKEGSVRKKAQQRKARETMERFFQNIPPSVTKEL